MVKATAVDRAVGMTSAVDSTVAVGTVCWVEAASAVGIVEAIPALDLGGTSLAAALMVVATAVVALVDCS